MKTGRNDPCPCGSGKKYKKCCIDKDVQPVSPAKMSAPVQRASVSRHQQYREHFIAPGEVGDYGEPLLNEEFLDKHPTEGMSAQMLGHVFLHNRKLVEAAHNIVRKETARGLDEEQRIREASSAEELIALMKQSPDPLNHGVLLDKLIEHADATIPLIIDELRNLRSDNELFLEVAIRAIGYSGRDYSEEVLNLIKQPVANAYALSQLSVLLGVIGNETAIKPLWDLYHFFVKKYPAENYAQGPLLALGDLYDKYIAEPLDEEADWEEEFDTPPELLARAEAEIIEQARALLKENRKVEAIKLFLNRYEAGLKESKDAVDYLQEHPDFPLGPSS